jgi:GntR family transcriptional regulator, transcriptional repressor for pyruvate dehydrogenase complex
MPRPALITATPPAAQLDIETKTLEILALRGDPVGANVLQRDLAEHGIELGPATAGRLLKQLDEPGLTIKHGRRGRPVSQRGYRHLEAKRRTHDRNAHGQRFLRSIDTESPLILLDVLIGRRAIERETARLAATRATEDELRTLQTLFDQHVRQKASGGDAVFENRDFHLFIARVAKSRVLETALELILAEASLSQVLIRMRRQAGSRSGDEHPRVVAAILERDPVAAEAAMVHHIDNIVHDLYRFHGGDLPAIEQIIPTISQPSPEPPATEHQTRSTP